MSWSISTAIRKIRGILSIKETEEITLKEKRLKFFITNASKKLKIIPEFYLTNDFKTFTLGGKLSYTF